MSIDVSDLNKADVLAALYNRAQVQGMGIFHATPVDMPRDEAEKLLALAGDEPYFDYLKGRVMKIKIGDSLDPRLYDRNNGDGACAGVIKQLRSRQTAS